MPALNNMANQVGLEKSGLASAPPIRIWLNRLNIRYTQNIRNPCTNRISIHPKRSVSHSFTLAKKASATSRFSKVANTTDMIRRAEKPKTVGCM